MTGSRGAPCPLCGGAGKELYNNGKASYRSCRVCGGIFLPAEFCLSKEAERKRYLTHKNDVNDPGYMKFAEPLVRRVAERFIPGKHEGLDFGAGTGPVASVMLARLGFNTRLYDPFFHPDRECLLGRYDYIIACEVIEHLRDPAGEFRLLKSLLNPGGELIIKTHLYSAKTPFASWYYKNDPAHVFFYSVKTLGWIKDRTGFYKLETDGERMAIFTKE